MPKCVCTDTMPFLTTKQPTPTNQQYQINSINSKSHCNKEVMPCMANVVSMFNKWHL